MREIAYSRARADLADLYDDALSHYPRRISRRRVGPAVLLSLQDVMTLLARFEFKPEVLYEGSSVSIWLPELSTWGRGLTFADARDDLLAEIDQLLALVAADPRLRSAPNTLQQLPWIYRLMLADDDDQRSAMLFAAPDESDAALAGPEEPAAEQEPLAPADF